MIRTLVVTNDFPPRQGGIQTFVASLLALRPPESVVVLASDHPGAAEYDAALPYPVVRRPTSMLLPTPGAARAAADLARRHGCDSAFFGAAAPLGLLAPALRSAGVRHLVGATHGHETGWVALPGARQLLQRIAGHLDVLTYISEYTHSRLEPALGGRTRLTQLSPGRRRRPVQPRRRRRRRPPPVRAGGGPGRRLRLPAGRAQGPGRAGGGLAPGPGATPRGAAAARRRRAGGGVAAPGRRRPGPGRLRRPHRAGAAARPARALRGRRRVRDAVPHPPGRPRRRGVGHGLPGGGRLRAPRRGGHLRRGPGDGARRRHGARGRPALARPRSPARSPTCSTTRSGRGRWARPAAHGWSSAGRGRRSPPASRSCSSPDAAEPRPARGGTGLRCSRSAGVEALDVGVELLHDDGALELQARREHPVVLGEVGRRARGTS